MTDPDVVFSAERQKMHEITFFFFFKKKKPAYQITMH